MLRSVRNCIAKNRYYNAPKTPGPIFDFHLDPSIEKVHNT